MGTYINPGNDGFSTVLRSEYVDKTALISEFDKTLDSSDKLVLVSRPRRFGKSYAAKMLAAYYSCGCDSRALFEGLEVSRSSGFEAHLNAFNVVSIDLTSIMQAAGAGGVVAEVSRVLLPELREIAPSAGMRDAGHGSELKSALADVVCATGRKFIFIIDEWDAVYRVAQTDRPSQDAYAELLRSLFKDLTFTDRVVAAAFLTGILPMRKYAHQSAVSDFREYTMVRPGAYAPFVGFTQAEVERLCDRHGLDIGDVSQWYDGYELEGVGGVYAPFSVMRACSAGKTGAYWVSTEAYESLRPYIEMDFDGLQNDLVRAIGGAALQVDPDFFQNDMTSIAVKDDVLTLLVHLGYLSYSEAAGTARVPNEEVRTELARAVARSRHPKLVKLMHDSITLLDDVVNMREEAAAAAFQRVHDRDCPPLFYNGEQALRSVVKTALIAAVDEYARIEELPGGRGYADVVYVPKRASRMPALVVELKWDKPVEAAIGQIRQRRYPDALDGLDVPILLVGVTYDAASKKHACRIEALGAE